MNVPSRTAARVAYAAAAVNLVAAAVMGLWLRHGIFLGDLSARMWVARHFALWRLGWLLWHAAAILLLTLFVVLSLRWRDRAPVLARVSLLVAAAGLAADLAAETFFIAFQPRTISANLFVVSGSYSVVLTGYLGNGLYTAAGIMLTWAGRRDLPRMLLWLSVPVWGAGLWLSAATLAGSEWGQVSSTAILMPMFVLWAFLLGRWLQTNAS